MQIQIDERKLRNIVEDTLEDHDITSDADEIVEEIMQRVADEAE